MGSGPYRRRMDDERTPPPGQPPGTHSAAAGDELGGRLPLLAADGLTGGQRALHEHLSATRGATAERSGYLAALPDGRLIGPFNALLRAPGVAEGFLGWVQAIAGSGLDPAVREAAVLAVGAGWNADYILYAHRAAARAAGLDEEAVEALAAGGDPEGADSSVRLAARLAGALLRDHEVTADLYDAALAAFGEQKLVSLLCLVGQYSTTSMLLACFRVPAPAQP